MGYIKRIPTYLQEQNIYAGLGNYLGSFFGTKVYTSFPNTEHLYRKKIEFVGPVLERSIEENKNKNESIVIKSSNNETPVTINKVIETENNSQVDTAAKLSNSIPIKSFRQFVDLFYQKREGILHTQLYNSVK